MWAVVKDNEVVKAYPFKLQCVVWCYEKGLVYNCGRYGDRMWDSGYHIVEVKEEDWE